jgi:hypothetical protein
MTPAPEGTALASNMHWIFATTAATSIQARGRAFPSSGSSETGDRDCAFINMGRCSPLLPPSVATSPKDFSARARVYGVCVRVRVRVRERAQDLCLPVMAQCSAESELCSSVVNALTIFLSQRAPLLPSKPNSAIFSSKPPPAWENLISAIYQRVLP